MGLQQLCVRSRVQSKVASAASDVTSADLNMHFRICQCSDGADGPVPTPSVNICKRRDECRAGVTAGIFKYCDR